MTEQEFFNSLTQTITDLTAQINAIASSITGLTAQRDHEQLYISYFNLIVDLATANGVALDNPKLLPCFDVAYGLAILENPVDPITPITRYFNAICVLIK